jgi:hypothetical protein
MVRMLMSYTALARSSIRVGPAANDDGQLFAGNPAGVLSRYAALEHQSSSDSSHTTLVDPVTLPTLAEIVA